jgi:hypothetical protein
VRPADPGRRNRSAGDGRYDLPAHVGVGNSQRPPRVRRTAMDFIRHLALLEIATLPYIVAGILPTCGAAAGFYWLAGAIILSLVKSVADAWCFWWRSIVRFGDRRRARGERRLKRIAAIARSEAAMQASGGGEFGEVGFQRQTGMHRE